jgi:Chaperone of endosialidase
MKTKNMTILHLRKSISPESFRGFLLTVVALVCFALSSAPNAFGVSPPPDGGYPGFNTAEGQNALFSLTTGYYNTASGYGALFSNTTGYKNTANGFRSLNFNTTGHENTAEGFQALFRNTTGSNNTAVGLDALYHNTADSNTAVGYIALFANTTGIGNTANGAFALETNATGSFNTATGIGALLFNSTGNDNTAVGTSALGSATDSNNTAVGYQALGGLSSGDNNTATGANALHFQIGSNNTADGFNALGGGNMFSGVGDANTAIGAGALGQVGPPFGSGSGNTALGSGAGGNLTSGDNNIYVGNPGASTESGTVRIGSAGTQTQTFIAGISGATVTGTAVVVSSSGQLGVAPSSARFKEAIKPMDKASEALLALKPVTFRYKHELDPDGIPQFGLVAEQVEKVDPDLVARDAQGEIYTVRYEAVNAMLLNEFLKEHRKVEEQEATITQLKKDLRTTVAQLSARLEEQDSKIQKVSDQLELSKSAPQMAGNNQ